MGKIECTKISGHFLQFALWFWNSRNHCALIRPSKEDCFFSPELPHSAPKGRCPPAVSNLSPPFQGWPGVLRHGLCGAGFALPEERPRTASKYHLHGAHVNKATSGALWCCRTQKRSGECHFFPKEVIPDIVSGPGTFVSRIPVSKQQLLQKIPLKGKGVSFYLGKETVVAWKQKDSAP